MNRIVDRIIAFLKRVTRYDQLEDAMLLNRYGARNMDELYTMIMLGRTNEPIGYWETKMNTLPARVVQWIITFRQTHKVLNRETREELAKSVYKTQVRRDLEAKRLARDQEKMRQYLKNTA